MAGSSRAYRLSADWNLEIGYTTYWHEDGEEAQAPPPLIGDQRIGNFCIDESRDQERCREQRTEQSSPLKSRQVAHYDIAEQVEARLPKRCECDSNDCILCQQQQQ